MASVTGRIKSIKQPFGGYIKPSKFDTIPLDDGMVLHDSENVHSSIVGTVVDYLTRFIMGAEFEDAFCVSLTGIDMIETFAEKELLSVGEDFDSNVTEIINAIQGNDDESIINACKLASFDVWYRSPKEAFMYSSPDCYKDVNPDQDTIDNIRTLINRSTFFLDNFGPVLKDGFTFEPSVEDTNAYDLMVKTGKGTYGGYTPVVSSGDGDFLTEDTIWDFKVSKSKPTSKHTLQLAMYWIMGQHSGQDIYKNISKIGVFNPRLNTIFMLKTKDIPEDTIRQIEDDVICYKTIRKNYIELEESEKTKQTTISAIMQFPFFKKDPNHVVPVRGYSEEELKEFIAAIPEEIINDFDVVYELYMRIHNLSIVYRCFPEGYFTADNLKYALDHTSFNTDDFEYMREVLSFDWWKYLCYRRDYWNYGIRKSSGFPEDIWQKIKADGKETPEEIWERIKTGKGR